VQDVLEVALGGMPLTTTVEGLERYAVNLRYSRDFRENLEALREIVVPAPTGAQVPLGQLAKIEVVHAPMGVKSEAAVPNAWIYVDVKGMDVGTYVQGAMRAVNEAVGKGTIKLPSGYNIYWSGEYEYMLGKAAADDCRPTDAADYHSDHLPEHAVSHQDGDRPACRAFFIGWRVLGPLPA
jgi:Cu(I)/Ag(I) efflux system membrane protein CusA/SilA